MSDEQRATEVLEGLVRDGLIEVVDEEVYSDDVHYAFGGAYILSSREGEYSRYLYDHTRIVARLHVVDRHDTPITLLVTCTTSKVSQDNVEYLQRYQADRLASGMLPLTFRSSALDARQWLLVRAADNGCTHLEEPFKGKTVTVSHAVLFEEIV